ncbi:hypothetical protein Tco_1341777, partial [Tanacetum coccineum]
PPPLDFVPESDLEEEPKEDDEDPEEDPADYPADRDDVDDDEEDEDKEEELTPFWSWERLLLELSIGDTLTSDRSLNKYSTLAAGRIGYRSLGLGSGSSLTGAPQGEELGLMKPLSVSSCSCSASSFISPLGHYLSVIIVLSVLHSIAWAASGVVGLTWEFHHVRAFPCRVNVANLTWHATVQLLML